VIKMMLSCADLGRPCLYKAIGKTPAQVKERMYEHASREHLNILNTLTIEELQEIDQKMDNHIRKEKIIQSL